MCDFSLRDRIERCRPRRAVVVSLIPRRGPQNDRTCFHAVVDKDRCVVLAGPPGGRWKETWRMETVLCVFRLEPWVVALDIFKEVMGIDGDMDSSDRWHYNEVCSSLLDALSLLEDGEYLDECIGLALRYDRFGCDIPMEDLVCRFSGYQYARRCDSRGETDNEMPLPPVAFGNIGFS
jgi:hypothetical protein